ncbi:hypothetical protein QFC21_003340 [Naganishia friedmannii]|uniref:Uncharacterized protein n=1 Tax=Naganishia friedmannii TaxID=89922 RepID=A0ACC2VP90_9TREE|nr:hypothetical protein QFC21_003340 [Naganishia friedmannii]
MSSSPHSMTYWSRSAPLFRSWRSINVEDVNNPDIIILPAGIVGYVLPTLIDLSIMFGMLWTLYRAKIDSDSVTQSLVRRLVAVVIETMTLPTLCMTLNAIMGLVFGDANSNERIFSYCQNRYQEQESRGRGFLTSSMEEKGRWRAQSGDDGFTKVTQRNGNGKISPQQALTRSIMKDYRVRQRNTRANMVDFVNSDSEECVLPPPIQTVPVKIESNASQTASVFSEYALSLDSRQKIVPPTQPSVSFEATRLPAPPHWTEEAVSNKK